MDHELSTEIQQPLNERLDTIAESPSRMQLFLQVQPHLVRVLTVVLQSSDDYLEYLETGLDILTYVTYFSSDVKDSSGNAIPPPALAEVAAAICPYVALFPAIVKAFHEYAYDYIPNMMSPIDNMIGYGTNYFLSASDPTTGHGFVQLTLGMVEKVFTNFSGERSNAREAICAAHLLLSLLHNCAGRIDAAVGPTLGLVLGRLDPKPTQKELPVRIPDGCVPGQAIPVHYFNFDSSVQCPPSAVPGSEVNFVITLPPVECPPNLKLALLQVIASAFFYNAALAFGHLDAAPGLLQKTFECWFKEIDDHGAEWPHLPTKLTILGWSAIMQLPVDRIPGIIRDILPTIISRCLQLVKELDDANQDDDEDDLGEEDDEDEEDEEGGEEEEDEENEEVEDEDDTEDQEEIAYLKSLKNESRKLFAMAKEYQDDGDDEGLYGEEDSYSSPIDDVDELLFFLQTLQRAHGANPEFYGAVQEQLAVDARQNYASVVQRAQQKAVVAAQGTND